MVNLCDLDRRIKQFKVVYLNLLDLDLNWEISKDLSLRPINTITSIIHKQ